MAGATVAGVVAYAGALGALCWISLLLRAARHIGTVPRIKDQPSDLPGPAWPSLAVVFAARDEEAGVERAVRSLLAQDYPDLRVVAVDDRSTDRTGALLDTLAVADSRLRVIHICTLPAGWLGKTHALQVGAEAADAEWLLFTDADVIFSPGSLRRAVGLAVRQQHTDLLVVAPDMVTETFAERVFLAFFLLLLAINSPPWLVTDRRSKAAVGAGAFDLVRAGAFRSVGGFERIALSVDDDLRLGQVLKFAGYHVVLAMGQDEVFVRWHVGLGGMIRGLEKNFFAALDFRPGQAVLVGLFLAWVGVLPWLGLVVGPWWTRLVCAGGIGAVALSLSQARGQNGMAWYHGLFLPVGAVALMIALYRSTWLTYRRGGVRWRGHLYPLPVLRDHVRRRNAWLREVWLSTR